MKQFHYALITAAFAALLLSACGSADTDTAGSSGDNSLVVLNYGKYLDASAIKMFEQETGIKIKLEEYESPEEMYTEVFCRFHQLRCRAHLGLYGGAADPRGKSGAD